MSHDKKVPPDVSAAVEEIRKKNADQAARVEALASLLRDVAAETGVRDSRKAFAYIEAASPEDGFALRRYLVDHGERRLYTLPKQPDYVIVYDETWERIIESYFVRRPDVAEDDEPTDTANGPVLAAERDALIAMLNSRYEPPRFRIAIVSADSLESVKRDIRWVLE